jgi:glutamyl-tRNA(Gln) amidotransferase subunit E
MNYNYEELGLKVGLEVHQQLDTGKLFCSCPCILREETPDIVFERQLRPTASELNLIDAAALEEFKKRKKFIYQGYADSTCLVEADEEPPHEMNETALKTVFEIALMVNARIFRELIPMRKIIIDGSNTSGFQRTTLIAQNGKLIINEKEIRVELIVLEEDASRIIERNNSGTIYRLDRLGIPLIEFTTAPDISTPEEAKIVAKEIGSLMRRTGKAKRGLGSIRQDLNVSIKGGARVEIKGVQSLELIDEMVKREIQRQIALIELQKEMIKRKINKTDLNSEIIDLSKVFKESECKFLKEKNVFGLKLIKMHELIGKQIQPKRRFGTELAGIVKIKTGLKGLLHSDELPAYAISEKEVQEVNSLLNCTHEDAFILVSGNKEKAFNALNAVIERIKITLDKGVISETRNALEDANSEYLRPIASSARMYPETDLIPIQVQEKQLIELKKTLPLTESQRFELYVNKFNLNEKLANQMKLSNYARFFEKKVLQGFNATTIASLLLDGLIGIKRKGALTENISEKMLEELFEAEKNKLISKDIMLELLMDWSKNPLISLNELISNQGLNSINSNEAEKIIKSIIEEKKDLIKLNGMHSISALMGLAMNELKGKMNGKQINELLKKEIEKKLNEK